MFPLPHFFHCLVLLLVLIPFERCLAYNSTTTCTDPSFHCSSCQPQGTCSQCVTGYYMLNETQPCIPCSSIEGCNNCNNFFGCAQCNDSYLHVQVGAHWSCLRSGTCKEPSYNCKVCHTNGCDQCNDGHYKMNYTQPCIPCSSITGCNSICNDFFGCAQCRTGYTLTKVEEEENNTHICESTRTKCGCTSPVANPVCPYSYKASCEPSSVIPISSTPLDPLDCSLWEWVTTCEQTCDPSHGCDNITKPSVNCNNPQYTCTTGRDGNCLWDYVCNDIVTVQCFGSMCNCDFETSYIGCTGGRPPVCECAPNPQGQCVTSMKCPPDNKTINCVQDLCLNCFDSSSQAPNCDSQSFDECLAKCIAFTQCVEQNNTCAYSQTPTFTSCLSVCKGINQPSPPAQSCSSLESLCECLSEPNCIYLLFQSSFTIEEQGLMDVNYKYARCVSSTELPSYVNDYAAGAVTSDTPGVRAQCYNRSTPVDPEGLAELVKSVSSNLIVEFFQKTLTSVLTSDQKQALQGMRIVLSGVVPPKVDDNKPNVIHVSLVVSVMSSSGNVSKDVLSTVIKNTISALFTYNNNEVKVDVVLSKVATSSSSKRSTHEQVVTPSSYLVESSIEVPLSPSPTPSPTPSITGSPTIGELSHTNFAGGGQSSNSGSSSSQGTTQSSNVGIIVGVVILVVIVLLLGFVVFLIVKMKKNQKF